MQIGLYEEEIKKRTNLDFSQEQTAFVPSAPVASAWQGLLFLRLARLLLSDLSCQNLKKSPK